MIPAYHLVIGLKIGIGSLMFVHKHDERWLVRYWFMLNTYAWVRIYTLWCQYLGVFRNHLYTVSVFLAGFTTFPAALGHGANVLIPFYMVIYVFFGGYCYDNDSALVD